MLNTNLRLVSKSRHLPSPDWQREVGRDKGKKVTHAHNYVPYRYTLAWCAFHAPLAHRATIMGMAVHTLIPIR